MSRAERRVRRARRADWIASVNDAINALLAERTIATESEVLDLPSAVPGLPLPVPPDIATLDAAYLAGILDSEGHLLVSGNNGSIALKVGSTARVLVDWLQHTAGGSVRLSHHTSVGNPYYVWSVFRHSDIELLLEQVAPYTVGKRAEARAMLAAIRYERELRDAGGTVDPRTRRELRLAIRAARAPHMKRPRSQAS